MTDKIPVIAVLFSGGCDSTLASAIAAERASEVRLLTYRRLGIFKAGAPLAMADRLKKKYPGTAFRFEIMDISREYSQLCYENYFVNIMKHGIKLVSVCGLCRLAMHWRTIIYCLENGINEVYDGAVEKAKTFPEQNRRIMIDSVKTLYSHFGIDYSNPVYGLGEHVEEELYKKGIIPVKKMKQTERDKQPVCIDNLLFSAFANYYLGTHTWEEYERDLSELYAEKAAYVKRRIEAERKDAK